MTPGLARTGPPVAAVLLRLKRLAVLSPQEEALILGLKHVQRYRPGEELAGEREAGVGPRFMVSGWAARVRWLPDGRRQIFNFVLPGDCIGLCLRPQPLPLSTIIALTRVETVEAGTVQRAINSDDPCSEGLRNAIHMGASYDEAFLLAQIMRLGRQTAYERLAHLILELRDRLEAAGCADRTGFAMPLTQEMLADATGLSIVHVNRILQQLRRDRLLEFHGGQMRLPDPDALEAVADYRPPEPAAKQPAVPRTAEIC